MAEPGKSCKRGRKPIYLKAEAKIKHRDYVKNHRHRSVYLGHNIDIWRDEMRALDIKRDEEFASFLLRWLVQS